MKTFEPKTLAQLIGEFEEKRHKLLTQGGTSGPWRFDPASLCIDNVETGYYINLLELKDSAGVLDWIIQISHKTWASDSDLGKLVRLIDRILGLQENICGSGVDKWVDVKDLIERRKHGQSRETPF